MAVRRARIKAVASLPVRRKAVNASQADAGPSQESSVEKISVVETAEKVQEVADLVESKRDSEEQNVARDTKEAMSREEPDEKQVNRRKILRPAINIPNRTKPQGSVESKADGTALCESPVFNNFLSPRLIPASPNPKTEAQSVNKSDLNNAAIDGITPLPPPMDVQTTSSMFLPNDCYFDPIIPLPSPTKVRPKLRPAPRLSIRRNSFQGSASESEEENRKHQLAQHLTSSPTSNAARQRHDSASNQAQYKGTPIGVQRDVSRVRTESFSSAIIERPPSTNSAGFTSAHIREKLASKSRSSIQHSVGSINVSATPGYAGVVTVKKETARRRTHIRPGLPGSALTIYDVIFYNPSTNSLQECKDTEKEEKKLTKEEIDLKQESKSSIACDIKSEITAKDLKKNPSLKGDEDNDADDEADPMPVPQLKLGPNGEIMLDEKSLVVDSTALKIRAEAAARSGDALREDDMPLGSRGTYTRAARMRDWDQRETLRFYRAIATLGTDFATMVNLFPGRNRYHLKKKYKKEEKLNRHLLEKALFHPISGDFEEKQRNLFEEPSEEEEEVLPKKEKIIKKKKEPKIKEPKIKELKIKEPKIKEPSIKEPKIKGPIKEYQVKEPKIKESKIKEPKVKEPKVKGARLIVWPDPASLENKIYEAEPEIPSETTTNGLAKNDFNEVFKLPKKRKSDETEEENDEGSKSQKNDEFANGPTSPRDETFDDVTIEDVALINNDLENSVESALKKLFEDAHMVEDDAVEEVGNYEIVQDVEVTEEYDESYVIEDESVVEMTDGTYDNFTLVNLDDPSEPEQDTVEIIEEVLEKPKFKTDGEEELVLSSVTVPITPIPDNLEAGSLVLMMTTTDSGEKIPRAYLATTAGPNPNLKQIDLPPNIVQTLIASMGITKIKLNQSGEKTASASNSPNGNYTITSL